jgi:hypothetical protein
MPQVKFHHRCGSYAETCEEFLGLALDACGYSGYDITKLPDYTDESHYVFEVDLHGSYMGEGDKARILEELRAADFEMVVIET